jgi:tRNA pseudouridine55 synthase
MLDGFLVLDKPAGLTSHDLVGILRAVTGLEKVGHTGTLDPFATGVLPLALGRSTRWIQFLDEHLKIYRATLKLGTTTDTGDLTGLVLKTALVPPLKVEQVQAVLQGYLGEHMQVPPRYSAVKVAGKALYEYARAGQEVEVRARRIEVLKMELERLEPPELQLCMWVSRGSYARVIGEELGELLGTLAHLCALCRLQSGAFTLEQAINMEQLATLVGGTSDWRALFRAPKNQPRPPWRPKAEVIDLLKPFVLPAQQLLSQLPSFTLSAEQYQRFLQGGARPPVSQSPCILLSPEGEFLTVHNPQAPA